MNNWRAQVMECDNAALATAIASGIEALLENSIYALKMNASEQHLAAELCCYLKKRVPVAPDGKRWDVHVEYNRVGRKVKTIYGEKIVRPDIIVHRTGTNNNLLAIELKKGKQTSVDVDDFTKLIAYRDSDDLRYRYALFLRFGVRKHAGEVTCVRWC